MRRAAETTPATPTPSVELPEEAASRLRSDERLTCQQTEEEGRASEERIEELCALRLTGRCDSSATTSMHHRRYQRHGRGQTQSCPYGDTIQGQHRHHAYSQLRPSSCKLELPRCRIHPYLTTLLLLLCTLCGIAGSFVHAISTVQPRGTCWLNNTLDSVTPTHALFILFILRVFDCYTSLFQIISDSII